MKKPALLLCTLLLVLVTSWRATAQEVKIYRVIVHPDNPVRSLSGTEVSKLLLKEVSRWDDGTSVEPVDQSSKADVRKAFSKEIHGRSAGSIVSYWQRQIFSGRQAPPPEANSDAEVIAFVASRPGAIGQVSSRASLDGSKS